MTRGGRKDQDDGPERKCIVSGLSQPKAGLIRFAISPEGVVVVVREANAKSPESEPRPCTTNWALRASKRAVPSTELATYDKVPLKLLPSVPSKAPAPEAVTW